MQYTNSIDTMLGVTSIATLMETRGYECRIFDDAPYLLDIADEESDPREKSRTVGKTEEYEAFTLPYSRRVQDLVSEIQNFQPDIVGVSTTEASYLNSLEYLTAVRNKYPSAVTLLGGAFGLSSPEMVLRHKVVDLVCIGEGETVIEDLCRRIEKELPIWETAGVAARKPSGEIVRNKLPLLININEIPPLRYDFYDQRRLYRPIGGKYRKVLPLEISRGCMYPCSFCNSPLLNTHFAPSGHYYRTKRPQNLDACIDATVKAENPHYFILISETFLAMKKGYLDAFCDVYRKYKVPFWMNTRPETVTEYNIQEITKVGLNRVSVGIESGNEPFRRQMLKRSYSNDLAIGAFRILHRHGIKTTANIIIGLPEETREMVFDSVRLVKEIKPDSIGLGIFQPYKGNELYNYCVKKGYYDPESIINHTVFQPSLNLNGTIESKELRRLFQTFSLYVKLDEKHWPEIDKIDIDTEDGWKQIEKFHDDSDLTANDIVDSSSYNLQ